MATMRIEYRLISSFTLDRFSTVEPRLAVKLFGVTPDPLSVGVSGWYSYIPICNLCSPSLTSVTIRSSLINA